MRGKALLVWLAIAGCGIDDTRTSAVEQAVSQCGSAFVDGIDVSNANSTIDWAKVKAAGRDFAFIKATQGDYDTQSTFGSNWTNAAANGVQRSAYHFFDPTIDGSAQAAWFLAELGSAGGMTAADFPPMLDIECPVSSSESASKSSDPNCEYTGNDGWIAPATIIQRTFDWIAAVTAATGRSPIVYSYPSWFADVMFTDPQLADQPLFIASYNACATVPAPWGSATFWQYSATTTVPGIDGDVDVDRFFGSAGDLATWNAGTLPDAGVPDAGVIDAAIAMPDAGTAKMSAAGCGCASSEPSSAFCLALATLLPLFSRRRRRGWARVRACLAPARS